MLHRSRFHSALVPPTRKRADEIGFEDPTREAERLVNDAGQVTQELFAPDRASRVVVYNSAGEVLHELREWREGAFWVRCDPNGSSSILSLLRHALALGVSLQVKIERRTDRKTADEAVVSAGG